MNLLDILKEKREERYNKAVKDLELENKERVVNSILNIRRESLNNKESSGSRTKELKRS